MENKFKKVLEEYSKAVISSIEKSNYEDLSKIVEVLLDAKDKGATIYTIGNGGSASTASHACNDLLKGCGVCGHVGFKTECLCDSLAVLSCLANDFDYESVFTIQLKAKAKAGDILIAYSGSGNSPNVINALNLAKQIGLKTIGFTGRDGGKLAKICDITVIAPHDCMEIIEDLHMMYVHSLSFILQKALTEKYSGK